MAIVKWDPFPDLTSFRDQLDALWPLPVYGPGRHGTFVPAIDVYDNADAIVLKAELAGMKPEVSEIFELLEFNRIIKSFDDLENAAMKAFPNLPKATRVAKRLRPLFSTEG